ncbi:MAG: hypothetical protein PF904_00160 [Kiritimatiellae bacterium]|nr:hypothetical protein [Kiritimatiellia bacterium]
MSGTLTTNFTTVTSNYLWQVFTEDVPTEEDVYALTLTYYINGTQIVESMTSHLAVVKGAFGMADVNTLSTSPKWSKITGNVVIPYDSSFSEAATNALTSQLVIAKQGGLVETNTFPDTVGYYGWKLANSEWGYGTFELSLTFPETAAEALMASLTRQMAGTVLIVRQKIKF